MKDFWSEFCDYFGKPTLTFKRNFFTMILLYIVVIYVILHSIIFYKFPQRKRFAKWELLDRFPHLAQID